MTPQPNPTHSNLGRLRRAISFRCDACNAPLTLVQTGGHAEGWCLDCHPELKLRLFVETTR